MRRERVHRVGVVGLGQIGLLHAETVHCCHIAELAAVADIDEAKAVDVAQRYGSLAFCDHRQLLDHADVDVVIIATPDHLHVEPALDCASARKHILLEKPLATKLQDADAIIQAVGQAGVQFSVGHCLRFDSKYVAVQERIAAGDLGEIESLHTRRIARIKNQERLRGRVSPQMFFGVHDYDIMNWFTCSPPARIYCESVSKVMRAQGYPVEDIAWTVIRYENDAVGVSETGWLLPDSYPRMNHCTLAATGTKGAAYIDQFDEGLTLATDSWTYLSTSDRLTRQLVHFLQCVDTGKTPLVTGADARLAVEMALAAELSALTHQPVALPLTQNEHLQETQPPAAS